ncbi:uncharacterized protein [Palaemon carinicauda]|uniref:uncharacterized protein n=1 Tax=Palaemon carinicauda TaxID=392227 RepID=UPI0035B592D9
MMFKLLRYHRHSTWLSTTVICLIFIGPWPLSFAELKCTKETSLGKDENAMAPFFRETAIHVATKSHHMMKFDVELKPLPDKARIKAQLVKYRHQMGISLWDTSVTNSSKNISKCMCLISSEDRHFFKIVIQDNSSAADIVIGSNGEIVLKSGAKAGELDYIVVTNLHKQPLNISFCGFEAEPALSNNVSLTLSVPRNCSLYEIYALIEKEEDIPLGNVFSQNRVIIYINFGLGLLLLIILIIALFKYPRYFTENRQN